jgi:hypothetical protein
MTYYLWCSKCRGEGKTVGPHDTIASMSFPASKLDDCNDCDGTGIAPIFLNVCRLPSNPKLVAATGRFDDPRSKPAREIHCHRTAIMEIEEARRWAKSIALKFGAVIVERDPLNLLS